VFDLIDRLLDIMGFLGKNNIIPRSPNHPYHRLPNHDNPFVSLLDHFESPEKREKQCPDHIGQNLH
jgi:hypothetical protein